MIQYCIVYSGYLLYRITSQSSNIIKCHQITKLYNKNIFWIQIPFLYLVSMVSIIETEKTYRSCLRTFARWISTLLYWWNTTLNILFLSIYYVLYCLAKVLLIIYFIAANLHKYLVIIICSFSHGRYDRLVGWRNYGISLLPKLKSEVFF